MSEKNLPKFDAPPVIETVLGVQFAQLSSYSNAHAGWFWKQYLDEAWDQVNEVPRLEDQFEMFGEDKWTQSRGGFVIQTQPVSERIQIVRSDNQRMIQVQNTRFIYNWRKPVDSGYPSYQEILPEFLDRFGSFSQFAKDSGNPDLELNQWEVTYVNHIEKGELWNDVSDCLTLFPKLGILSDNVPNQTLDNFRGSWTFAIDENKGKLHVEMKQVKLGTESGPVGSELILLQLTARGPVNSDVDLKTGFDLGHEAIVRTFADITSASSHKIWKRKE